MGTSGRRQRTDALLLEEAGRCLRHYSGCLERIRTVTVIQCLVTTAGALLTYYAHGTPAIQAWQSEVVLNPGTHSLSSRIVPIAIAAGGCALSFSFTWLHWNYYQYFGAFLGFMRRYERKEGPWHYYINERYPPQRSVSSKSKRTSATGLSHTLSHHSTYLVATFLTAALVAYLIWLSPGWSCKLFVIIPGGMYSILWFLIWRSNRGRRRSRLDHTVP